MPWLTPQTVSWLAKPWRVDRHHHLSSHKTQGDRERSRGDSSGGRGGCRHTTADQSTHHLRFLSATHCLENAESVHFTGWTWMSARSFTFHTGGFCCRRWPRCRWVSTLRFAPDLGFQQKVFFFPLRQDVARYWFSSASDAFMGCRIKHQRLGLSELIVRVNV